MYKEIKGNIRGYKSMIDIYGGYVYKKNIDWSVLHQGISIPVTIQKKFIKQASNYLDRGQSKPINLILNGKTYKAKLVNQLFNQEKYGDRADIVQIRYVPTSDIAVELRMIFNRSYQFLKQQREIDRESGRRRAISLPDDINESIAIYITDYPDTYVLECFNANDYNAIRQSIINIQEQDFEYSIDYNIVDEKATIEQKILLTKVRRLNRAIGECLKELYEYRCQICGTNISYRYGISIAESHHIIPFIKSLNNNANNQIIVCPNHHRIIHKAEPEFKKEKLMFIYSNGFEEKIKMNRHL